MPITRAARRPRVPVRTTRVGNPTRIDGPLQYTSKDIINMDIAWAGDKFMIVYEVNANGTTTLRTVALRCDGAAK